MLLRVQQCRKEAGLSQAALAEKLTVSRELISAIETARYCPNVALLVRIATALHVPLTQLLPAEEGQPKTPPRSPGCGRQAS